MDVAGWNLGLPSPYTRLRPLLSWSHWTPSSSLTFLPTIPAALTRAKARRHRGFPIGDCQGDLSDELSRSGVASMESGWVAKGDCVCSETHT